VANVTFIPSVVPREHLTERNGLINGTTAATQIGGPALGGLLVQAVGAAASLVVDAVTYVVSAVVLSRIRQEVRAQPGAPGGSFFGQVKEGLVFVLRHPVMRPSVIAATAMNFANGALLAVTAPYLVRTLDVPVGVVGLVIAADGVGSIIGAALTARLVRRWGGAPAILATTAVGWLLSVLMPLAAGPAALLVFGVGMAGLAVSATVLSVVTRTHRQLSSPPELLSRVMASVRFISWSATPVGALVAGAMSQLYGPRAGFVALVAGALVAPLTLWCSRIRTLRELADGDPIPATGSP
jgi:predicted MFS family arabinose efflux permease